MMDIDAASIDTKCDDAVDNGDVEAVDDDGGAVGTMEYSDGVGVDISL